MPTATYTPLANITLGSSAASVTFSSISQAYRDLVLVVTGTPSSTSDILMRLNSDTGSNYYVVAMYGDGANPGSAAFSATSVFLAPITWNNTDVQTVIVHLMDYSATDKHKTILSRGNSAAKFADAVANRWANTAAVTTIQMKAGSSNNWLAGTSMALYGIAA